MRYRWVELQLAHCEPSRVVHTCNACEMCKRTVKCTVQYISLKLKALCLTRPVRLPNEQTRGQPTNSACSSDVRQAFILIDNALSPLSTHTPACPGTAAPHPICGTVRVERFSLCRTKGNISKSPRSQFLIFPASVEF